MVHRIDLDDRKRLIADAVCALAEKRGLEGVSIREVAGEADLSLGAVQRCFRDKDDMLAFTLRHIGARFVARTRDEPDLLNTATQLALLEDAQRGEARVWLTFVAQAAVDPALATILRTSYAELRAMFTRLIDDSTTVAEPELEAGALVALTDGLTTQVLFGHLSTDEAAGILRHHVRGLSGG